MLGAKSSAYVAPEVNPRESTLHLPLQKAKKAGHSLFETQRRPHQKPKTGILVAPPPPQKDMCLPKTVNKKIGKFGDTKIKCKTSPNQVILNIRSNFGIVSHTIKYTLHDDAGPLKLKRKNLQSDARGKTTTGNNMNNEMSFKNAIISQLFLSF